MTESPEATGPGAAELQMEVGQRKPLSLRPVGFLKHKVLDKGQLNIGRMVYLSFRKSCVQAPAPHEIRCGGAW